MGEYGSHSSFRIAAAGSVILHMAVAGLFFNLPFPSPDTPATIPAGIQVRFSEADPRPPEDETLADEPDPVAASTPPPAPAVTETEPPPAQDPPPEDARPPAQAVASDPGAIPPSADEEAGDADTGMISQARLADSVAAFVRGRNSELTRDWVGECLRYRNRRGRADDPCKEDASADVSGQGEVRESIQLLFSDMLPGRFNTVHIRRYQAENQVLAGIVELGGAASEYARVRYNLNLENIKYLQRSFSTDPPMGFSMRICIPMPCVFRYTGFEVVRPEGMEAEPEAFPIASPLFPVQD